MPDINILKISIYQIQMFLSVARTLNLSSSARFLHISPSMLSKNISSMEQELGLVLFLREKGRLKLTPAGQMLAHDFSDILESIECSIDRAHTQQRVETQPLRIGYPDCSRQNPVLSTIIQSFKAIHPQFQYCLEFYRYNELPLMLKNRNIDVFFTVFYEMPALQDAGISCAVLDTFPLTAVMSKENPLSDKNFVYAEDLLNMKLVIPARHTMPNYYNRIILPLFHSFDKTPEISYQAYSSQAVVSNIITAQDVLIADPWRKIDSIQNLVSIPIQQTESGIVLAWQKHSHPLTAEFVSVCKSLINQLAAYPSDTCL